MSKVKAVATPCYCGSGTAFSHCCQPYLLGLTQPQTVEALMRSRFCAYLTHHAEYLLASWHPSTRPPNMEFEPQLKWVDLQVQGAEQVENSGRVQFSARYKLNGRMQTLRENSRFTREEGCWYYLDGDIDS